MNLSIDRDFNFIFAKQLFELSFLNLFQGIFSLIKVPKPAFCFAVAALNEDFGNT